MGEVYYKQVQYILKIATAQIIEFRTTEANKKIIENI